MVNLDVVPAPNPKVIGRIVNNEAVLVLPDIGKVKVLNEVGARIWSLVDGTLSLRQIAALICTEYQVSQAEAEADTQAFLDDLAGRGVVFLTGQPG